MAKINKVYVYLVEDESGEEGLAGVITPQGGRPLIAVTDEILNEIRPLAQDFSNISGLATKLVQFDVRKEIETLIPTTADTSTMTEVPEGDPDYQPKMEDFKSEK